MKRALILMGAVGGLILLSAGCDWLNPAASKGTVEVSDTYSSGSNICPIVVNLDGSNAATLTAATTYQFPLASPGSHTLNLSTYGNGSCGGGCSLDETSVPFQVSGGTLYVIVVSQGDNCDDMHVSGP
jgi:hypothetical protein